MFVCVYMHKDLKMSCVREIKGINGILGISTPHIISGKHSWVTRSCSRAGFSIPASVIVETVHINE